MKPVSIVLIVFILICSGLSGLIFSLYQHSSQNNLTNTPKAAIHSPTLFVKQLSGNPNAGEKVFNAFCVNCHGKQPIIDVNAPRIGDRKTWQLKSQLGMEKLLQLTIMGVGAMPARGGCFECNDELLRQTIQYMLKSK